MADDATPHADVLNSTAQGQLKSITERLLRLDDEKSEITKQSAEVYAESKGSGFDPKVLRKVVRELKRDRAKRQEENAVFDLYAVAVGLE